MWFTIREETNEMLHSALGSSGSFLEGKETDAGYLSYSKITNSDSGVHRNLTVTESQEHPAQNKHAWWFSGLGSLIAFPGTRFQHRFNTQFESKRKKRKAVVECKHEGVLGSPGVKGRKALRIMFI